MFPWEAGAPNAAVELEPPKGAVDPNPLPAVDDPKPPNPPKPPEFGAGAPNPRAGAPELGGAALGAPNPPLGAPKAFDAGGAVIVDDAANAGAVAPKPPTDVPNELGADAP